MITELRLEGIFDQLPADDPFIREGAGQRFFTIGARWLCFRHVEASGGFRPVAS
jgi:hypothetical protein